MSLTRKLVTIFYADVAGYSRLTGADEEGTHQRVMAVLDGVAESIRSSGGTVLRHAGDAILAVFPSVVGAVTTSAGIQAELGERNAGVPDDQRVEIRIGINLGDVIEDRGEVYGDGVNLAARLEAAAEPGGLCISDAVYGQIRRKTELVFEDGGEHHFKNIELPVRVHRWSPEPRHEASQTTSTTASQTLPLPDKPSIAVLPFMNMSGDPEQEYFADGITEDIITELSRFRDLFVIARNSSFRYKGQSPKIQDVGLELGVRYVVEGSVRKMGPRLRISAQLIEAASGSHLWAERYDRVLEDVFEVQDEVVTAIAGAVPGALGRVAFERARQKSAVNLTAYDCLLRGRRSFLHSNDDLGIALDWLNRAIEADPGYALAHSYWAMAYAYGVFNLGLEPEVAFAQAREHAAKAVALEEHDARIHANVAVVYILAGEHRFARTHSERAIALNPNDPEVLNARGIVLNYLGEQRPALECFAGMQRVDPYGTDDKRLEDLTDCLYLAGEYAKLIETYGGWQSMPAHLYPTLAAAHAQLGQHDEARAAAAEYERKRRPEHNVRTYVEYQLRMCSRQSDRDHWLEGYRKAGFDV